MFIRQVVPYYRYESNRWYGKTALKSRIGRIVTTIILIAIVTFLTVDVGFALYQPERLAAALPECTLDTISGDILVMEKNSLSWIAAEDGMALEPGTRIRTTDEAQASLTFLQGTTTKLEPGTDIIIHKIKGSEAEPDTVVLKQQSGKTWNQVGKTDSKCDFKIQTFSTDISVHGTLFSTEVDESGNTIVQTTEGEVSVKAGGQEVRVNAGQMTEVIKGTTPSSTTQIPSAFNELVFTVYQAGAAIITNSSGASSGYLADGSPINQISGSQISQTEDSSQTIRLREPDPGGYTIAIEGNTDNTSYVSVEGFIEGKRRFIQNRAYDLDTANELVLNLHYDILEGVIDGASALANEFTGDQQVTQSASSSGKTLLDEPSDKTQPWFGTNGFSGAMRWIAVGIILVLAVILYFSLSRNNR